jgi:electron transport complex protein RnfC
MTAAANSISAGYSFSSWPASPPVFDAIAVPAKLRVPLSQYLPPQRVPFERAGAAVRAGERITASLEAAHAPLAPATGRVRDATTVTLLTGDLAPAVELETDAGDEINVVWESTDNLEQLNQLVPARAPRSPPQLSEWIERLRDAGVWAARRTSPDLLGQLHQGLRRPLDTVLCSVLDVDPSACLNAALAALYPLELIAGLTIIGAITQATRAGVVLDARVPPAWTSAMRRAAGSAIRMIPLVNEYPQADPTLLLYALLGRRLRPGRLPTDQGVVILDAAAAVAVGRVAMSGLPMLSVPVAMRDHSLRQTSFVFAPIGASIADLARQTRVSAACTTYRAGDVLRDVRVPPDAVVGGAELIVHASLPEPAANPDPCIRCGWCVESCPTRVQPAGVLEAAQHEDIELADHYGIEGCIECGICSYVCPSRLPLLPAIRQMRAFEGDTPRA